MTKRVWMRRLRERSALLVGIALLWLFLGGIASLECVSEASSLEDTSGDVVSSAPVSGDSPSGKTGRSGALLPAGGGALSTSLPGPAGATRMLTAPALSGNRLAFVYGEDLWGVELPPGAPFGTSGALPFPRRLTAEGRVVGAPVFSPDGRLLAVSLERNGNIDVYVLPAEGGALRRITWHGAVDLVQQFSADGRTVLFVTNRESRFNREYQLYAVPVEGGFPRRMPLPQAFRASLEPGGTRIAYNPLPPAFLVWKDYRGGMISTLMLYNMASGEAVAVPKPEGGCNDADPRWIGGRIYFRSDRRGEFNLYSYDPATKDLRQLTRHDDFPVLSFSGTEERLVYEQAGLLHCYDLSGGATLPLPLSVPADLPETRERYAKGADFIQGAAISPSGARALFALRGDIVTVPAEKGEPRNLSASPGVHDRWPLWSPDGRFVTWFADLTGEYSLLLRRQDGKGPVWSVPLDGRGFYESPSWSPDGTKLAYRDNDWNLYWIDLSSLCAAAASADPLSSDLAFLPDPPRAKKIAAEPLFGMGKRRTPEWSPDSRWIAYTLNEKSGLEQLHLYSLEQDRSFRITDGAGDVSCPVFDRSGKYLYFFGSTDAGPAKFGLDMSTRDMNVTRAVYAAVLAAETPSPLAPESDEEAAFSGGAPEKKGEDPGDDGGDEAEKAGKGEDGDKKDEAKEEGGKENGDGGTPLPGGENASGAGPFGEALPVSTDAPLSPDLPAASADVPESADKAARKDKPSVPPISVDVDGLAGRILPLPVPPGALDDLQAGGPGKIFYTRTVPSETGFRTALFSFDLKEREETGVLPSLRGYRISADGKRMLVAGEAGWSILSASGGRGDGKPLPLEGVRVPVEPRAEWAQMFTEAWRINRDYFYDPGMHGQDWEAVRAKYAPFLPHLACRNDLNRLLAWMLSELRVGHLYIFGGDIPEDGESAKPGVLGADFAVENGRYRFARIYGGLNWNPDLRAPLAEPGVDVKEGDYLLRVNGREVRGSDNVYAFFEQTAERATELVVAEDPEGTKPRTVTVVPVASDRALRLRSWVEGNVRRVEAATNGRVGYVYLPNTAGAGQEFFKRYFFAQAPRDGVILDVRSNGGGQFADYVLDVLRRNFTAGVALRPGMDYTAPGTFVPGPKVMLIDECAGSGGDMLPWAFRRLGLGTLVGKRTWGGLVGISSYPPLMDGGWVTAPSLGIWSDEGWVAENVGIAPDVEVEQDPRAVLDGGDPQLDAAIRIVLEQLEANPPVRPVRPPYPDKTRH
ncbi:S41 family peptidase [Aminiphilus circumscriptus]|uniref:S41 family peptidase n=1 Tax=Aminiphilus circumscriptus TaxID=290732 RepID=UPI00146FAF79|nr:S41 family peptidase [Aminiphilus circumscriptus]